MNPVVPLLLSLPACIALAWAAARAAEADKPRRFLIQRTFPPGALDGLDAAAKQRVNANNSAANARWVRSYANAELTRTYCIYEGPSVESVRDAAVRNGLPIDAVFEIPLDLEPGPRAAIPEPAERFLIHSVFAAGALDGFSDPAREQVNDHNAALGVQWVVSHASGDKTRVFGVYRGPNERAVRAAAVKNAIPVESITAIPVDLWPN